MIIKSALKILVLLILCTSVRAQGLETKVAENPLDLAFLMIKSHDSPEDYSEELWDISLAYFRAGRKSDALAAIDLMRFDDRKSTTLTIIAHWLIRDKKYREAEFYLSKASEVNRKNVYGIDLDRSREIAAKWCEVNKEERASEELKFQETNAETASVGQAIAEFFIKTGNHEKASDYLLKASENIEEADNTELSVLTKAQIAFSFSEIKNKKAAEKLIAEVERDYLNVDYSKTYPKKDEIYRLITETRLNIGDLEKGFGLIRVKFDENSAEGLLRLAEAKIKVGLREEGKVLLQKLSIFDDNPREQLEAIKLFLQLGEDVFAVELAKNILPNWRFDALKTIAEKFIEKGKSAEAIAVLNFAFESIVEEDESDFEYSDYWTKENNLDQIIDLFEELKRPDLALKIINLPYKTNKQADKLAVYTLIYKDKVSRKKALDYLNQAHQILRKNKRKITEDYVLESWLKTAVQFSAYGEKQKALEMFTEALGLISGENYLSDSEINRLMVKMGGFFEKSKLVADKDMKIALKKIKDKWLADNF